MKKLFSPQIGLYVLAGTLSVGGAFLISLQFVRHGHAQGETAPPQGEAQAQQQQQGQSGQSQQPPGQPPPPSANAAGASPPGGPPSDFSGLEGFLEPYIYDQVNRRDPFMPYAEYVPPDASGPSRPMTPAQRFDLEQLKLVGIMWDVKDPKAMFMDPESEVIVLGRDEGIGKQNGYIASIREGEVVVVEATRKRGDVIYKTKTLRIER